MSVLSLLPFVCGGPVGYILSTYFCAKSSKYSSNVETDNGKAKVENLKQFFRDKMPGKNVKIVERPTNGYPPVIAWVNCVNGRDVVIYVDKDLFEQDSEAAVYMIKEKIGRISHAIGFYEFLIQATASFATAFFSVKMLSTKSAFALTWVVTVATEKIFGAWLQNKAGAFARENCDARELAGGRRFYRAARLYPLISRSVGLAEGKKIIDSLKYPEALETTPLDEFFRTKTEEYKKSSKVLYLTDCLIFPDRLFEAVKRCLPTPRAR